MDIPPFVRLIKEKCGLFINDHKHSSLTQAIRERMSTAGIDCHAKYFNTLLGDIEETHRLVDLLTNNETYFLRETQHFEIFSKNLIPQFLSKRRGEGKKIKVLSAGCSTGEEPYSMILSLVEKFGPQIMDSIEIIGCDINQNAIRAAREAIYRVHSFRSVKNDFKDKYFNKLSGGRYQLKDYLKKSVEFIVWNMVSNIYPRVLMDTDIIFYRNVSIYFETDTRKTVFNRLSDLLSDDGYLFLSSSETFPHNMGPLFLEENEGTFLYRKRDELWVDDRRKAIAPSPIALNKVADIPHRRVHDNGHRQSTSSDCNSDTGRNKTEDVHTIFDKALSHARNKENEDALSHLDALLDESPSFTKAHNLKASILIHEQRMDEARNHCLKALEVDEWNLDCHLLLGLIAKMEENEQEAMAKFKGALYIDPGCWLAHMYLGDIHNALGELNGACREYGLAAKLLKKNGKEQESFFLFPLAFSLEQVIHMCEHNMNNLKQRLSLR